MLSEGWGFIFIFVKGGDVFRFRSLGMNLRIEVEEDFGVGDLIYR